MRCHWAAQCQMLYYQPCRWLVHHWEEKQQEEHLRVVRLVEHPLAVHLLVALQLPKLVNHYPVSRQVANCFVRQAEGQEEGHLSVAALERVVGASWRQWQGWFRQLH